MERRRQAVLRQRARLPSRSPGSRPGRTPSRWSPATRPANGSAPAVVKVNLDASVRLDARPLARVHERRDRTRGVLDRRRHRDPHMHGGRPDARALRVGDLAAARGRRGRSLHVTKLTGHGQGRNAAAATRSFVLDRGGAEDRRPSTARVRRRDRRRTRSRSAYAVEARQPRHDGGARSTAPTSPATRRARRFPGSPRARTRSSVTATDKAGNATSKPRRFTTAAVEPSPCPTPEPRPGPSRLRAARQPRARDLRVHPPKSRATTDLQVASPSATRRRARR